MADIPIDTNVILRYLVENPETIDPKFKGVCSFFGKLEAGTLAACLPELVLFQAYFVLTSYYEVPREEAAKKLERLLNFRGIEMNEKQIVADCLRQLQQKSLDLVDAYLLAWAESKGVPGVYSFGGDLATENVEVLPVK